MSVPNAERRTPNAVAGLTLVEVAVAIGILASGLAVLLHSQTLSVRAVTHARTMTAATMLARLKMVELEDELRKEGFGTFSEEEDAGDFSDEGHAKYRWRSRVEKIELPGAVDLQAGAGAAESLAGVAQGLGGAGAQALAGAGAAGMGGAADAMSAAASIMGAQIDLIREVLQESIRKVTVTVEWEEGNLPRTLAVQAYFTDPLAIDAAGTLVPPGGNEQERR